MAKKQKKSKTGIDIDAIKRKLEVAEAEIKKGRDELNSLRSDIEDKLECTNEALETIEEAKLQLESARDKISELM